MLFFTVKSFMIWLNPVPNLGWYCNTTPVPAVVFFSQGVYVVSTPSETQNAPTLAAAEQLGHDMVLGESQIIKSLGFRAFSIDTPTDGQQVYAIDSSNVITTGIYSLSGQTIVPTDGSAPIAESALVGWSSM